MKIGYTSGIFDLFHQGHKKYLLTCKELCDFLIVGIDSDCRTKLLKGDNRPIDNITARVINVNNYCDYAFEKNAPSDVYINKYHPDILFRSTDNEKTNHYKYNNVIYIPYTQGVSTTLLISELDII